jgi:hypothetical protein
VQFSRSLSTFRRKMLPQFSVRKSKPRKLEATNSAGCLLASLARSFFDTENGGGRFLGNVGKLLSD